jgi:hypothetical protein
VADQPAGSGEGTPPSPPATPRPIASADERSRPRDALPPLPSAGASPLAPTGDRARSGSAPPPTPIRDERSRPHALPPVAPPLPPAPRASTRADTEPRAGVAEHRAVRAPLIGRATQLEVLRDVVQRAVDFQAPQLVTLVGNQGTGKTRLVHELVRGLKHPIRAHHGRARAGEPGSALASILRDRFGGGDARDRFAAEIVTIFGAEAAPDVLHCLGRFVGLDFPASAFLQVVADNPRHKPTTLARTTLAPAGSSSTPAVAPLVLVLDDLHAADDRTLTVLTELAAGAGRLAGGHHRRGPPRDAGPDPGLGRGRGRSRADRSAQPRARRRRGHVHQPAGAVRPDPRRADHHRDRADRRQPAVPRAARAAVPERRARSTPPAGRCGSLDVDGRPRDRAADQRRGGHRGADRRPRQPDERDLLEKAAVLGNVFWQSRRRSR